MSTIEGTAVEVTEDLNNPVVGEPIIVTDGAPQPDLSNLSLAEDNSQGPFVSPEAEKDSYARALFAVVEKIDVKHLPVGVTVIHEGGRLQSLSVNLGDKVVNIGRNV